MVLQRVQMVLQRVRRMLTNKDANVSVPLNSSPGETKTREGEFLVSSLLVQDLNVHLASADIRTEMCGDGHCPEAGTELLPTCREAERVIERRKVQETKVARNEGGQKVCSESMSRDRKTKA